MLNPTSLITKIVVFLAALFVILVLFQYANAAPRPSSQRGNDNELLARVITAEAESEPYTGQVAVGAVILNRAQNPRYPKTLAGVIYQPQAFESVSNGAINRPASTSARKAAQAALSGWDPSGGALFFFNPAKIRGRSYVWTRRIIQRIGKHVFAL